MQKKGLVYNKRSKIHRHTNPIITKKLLVKAYLKAQSAMEYLMTYGWAILIIAVVLGAFFQLGVFNPSNFAPKALPGSCHVFRPNGPGTTSFINLEGICSGELPQYVAQFNGNANIFIKAPMLVSGSSPITVAGWFNYNSAMPDPAMLWSYGVSGNCGAGNYFSLRYNYGSGNSNPTFTTDPWCNQVATALTPIAGVWYFIVETANTTGFGIYVGGNGKLYSNSGGPAANIISSSYFEIATGNDGSNFIGYISNLQIYNTSLSANEIQALYQEGIGGAPIDLQHLVAWYPLNGDLNDYSGNGNNGGVPTNVKFVSNWWNGYTPP